MPQDNLPKDRNYGLNLSVGTHTDCWYLTLTQGAQTFSMFGETPEEKRNFLMKLNSLKGFLESTIPILEKQTL